MKNKNWKVFEGEAVDHPQHYNTGKIEVIEAIVDWGLDFRSGNVVKYVARHQHKDNPLQDLKKAKWYLEHLIEQLENTQEKKQTSKKAGEYDISNV